MTVTIKDVAKAANVATSTVSRTIKDSPSISPETKKRVRKVMEKLGYVPNAAAQNLASKTARSIGVILPPFTDDEKVSNPFFMEVLNKISQRCNIDQYTTSLVSGQNVDELLQAVKITYQHKRVDGFILLYSLVNDPVIDYLESEKIPFVLVGTPYAKENSILYVDNDNFSSGKSATQFLLSNGHKKIAFVGFASQERVHQERYEGYFIEMRHQKLQPTDYYKITEVDDYLAFIEYLKIEKPTALIACDDQFALKLIEILRQQNLIVGEDISVISFNNSVFSTLMHPYLTTVDIHATELAQAAANAVLNQLKQVDKTRYKIIIPHNIIQRETVIDINN